MPFPEYSFQSKKWGSFLLDIRQAIEKGTEVKVKMTGDLSRGIQRSFENLHADFNWGLMLVAEKLDEQTTLIRQVVAQLAALQKTLDAPLLTQVRELFALGQDRIERGRYEHALQFFRQAEEKIDDDFLLQLQIGRTYLYGRNEKEDVLDAAKAEMHLLLAARYAKDHQNSLQEWRFFVGIAYFHATWAAYLQAKDDEESGRREQAQLHLGRALDHAAKTVQVWPEFAEGMYLHAKILCLVGRPQAAINEMECLVDRDRRYFGKANNDEDFNSLRRELENLSKKILHSPGPISSKVRDLYNATSTALKSAKEAPLETDDLTNLQLIAAQISNIGDSINRMDAELEALSQELEETRQQFLRIVNNAVRSKIQSLDEASRLNYERICEIERSKVEYTGEELGCLLWLVLWFVVAPVLVFLLDRFVPYSDSLFVLFLFSMLVGGPLLYALRKNIGSLYRTPSLNAEIASLRQAIAQRDHQIATRAAWHQNWAIEIRNPPTTLPPPPV